MTTPPNKDDLIKLAEFELKRIDDLRREHGWTPWILWAALAGLVWQSVGQQGTVLQWVSVFIYWAVLVLCADFLRTVLNFLTRDRIQSLRRQSPRYFSAPELLSASRPLLIFVGAKAAGAATIILKLGGLPIPAQYLWAILYGMSVLGSLCFVLSTWVDWPIFVGVTETTWGRRILLFCTWLTQAVALFVMFDNLAAAGLLQIQIHEARFALLLFGISEIVGWLLAFKVNDPIRSRLVQVRRALAIGDISTSDAKQRLEVILYGEEQSMVVRARVQACLTQLDQFTGRWESATQSVLKFSTSVSAAGLEWDLETANRNFKAVTAECRAAASAFSDVETGHLWFEARATVTASQAGDAAVDLVALRQSLKDQVVDAEKKNQALALSRKTLEREFDLHLDKLRANAGTRAI